MSYRQFKFDAFLKIGDGSTETWFADSLKQVWFADSLNYENYLTFIEVTNNAHLTFGELIDESTKRTKNGVSLYAKTGGYLIYTINGSHVGADINLYSSYIRAGFYVVRASRIWETTLDGLMLINVPTNGLDIYRSTVKSSSYALSLSSVAGSLTINEFYVHTCNRMSDFRWGLTATLRNVVVRNTAAELLYLPWFSGNLYLVDWDTDEWSFLYFSTTGTVWRQYTFNLKVTELDGTAINGATVTLKDKDDNQVFSISTAADGTITEQTVSRGYYDYAGDQTLQDYSPHKLIIEKAGFQTYEVQGITMEKINWIIKLGKSVGILFDCGSPIINLNEANPLNANVLSL